jgi:lauroyl/myristoyl acyltransferase
MKPNIIVERFCMALVYLIVKLRLQHLLRRVAPATIHGLGRTLASALLACAPSVEAEIKSALHKCYPDLDAAALASTAREHLAHVILNTLLFPITGVASFDELEAMIDYSALEPLVEASRSRMVVLVATHFYHFLLVPLLSELFYRAGVAVCCSFQFNEDAPQLRQFLQNYREKYHGDFHIPINVAKKTGKNAHAVREYLARPHGAVAVFGDVRFRPRANDQRFEIGRGALFANNGFSYVVANAPASTLVVSCHLMFADGKFRLQTSPPMAPDEAVQRYYGAILPAQIAAQREQWQLWFMSRALMMQGEAHAG